MKPDLHVIVFQFKVTIFSRAPSRNGERRLLAAALDGSPSGEGEVFARVWTSHRMVLVSNAGNVSSLSSGGEGEGKGEPTIYCIDTVWL